jgi:hypothetical protein
MNQPIGISFLPSQENADQGAQRGNMEGDLGQALKILSLRLPRVLGARAITPGSNLGTPGQSGTSQGALSGILNSSGTGGESGAYNPNAALFQALIAAMMGNGSSGGGDGMGGGGRVDPYVKFVNPGEPDPGTFNPNPIEDGDSGYRKPEVGGGGIVGTGPEIGGTESLYRKQPFKNTGMAEKYAFNSGSF